MQAFMRLALVAGVLIGLGFAGQLPGPFVLPAQAAEATCGSVSCCDGINGYFTSVRDEINLVETPAFKLPKTVSCSEPLGRFVAGLRLLKHLVAQNPDTFGDIAEAFVELKRFSVAIGDLKSFGSWATTSSSFQSMIFAVDLPANLGIQAEVIAHELVHAHWGAEHVTCLHGQRRNERACDDDVSEQFSSAHPLSHTISLVVCNAALATATGAHRKGIEQTRRDILDHLINNVPSNLR